jgi:histidinol-phosphate/aromatic aminotransferase/cobyric acid decarboxylase-like protein
VARQVPPAGAHGGDGPQIATALGLDPASILDLSLSLNPLAPDVAHVLARHLDAASRYPDPTAATETLANAMAVDVDDILITNGGSEAIALVAAEVGGTVAEPDYSLYPRNGGARWRSNPHNPTGVLAAPSDVADVWDEAFWPLATGTWTRGDHRRGAGVVGSLTKLFACPGLRIGYVLSEDADLLDRLRRRQPAWAVNGLAVAALPDLVATAELRQWSTTIAALRRALVDVLSDAGLAVRDTDAPWVLVDDVAWLRAALAPEGIVVRDCTSFGMPGVVRIAVPDDIGRARLATTLDRLADRGLLPTRHHTNNDTHSEVTS